jgi:hypothetical protein
MDLCPCTLDVKLMAAKRFLHQNPNQTFTAFNNNSHTYAVQERVGRGEGKPER